MTDLPETLLVPVDGSKNSNSAAAYAARMAEKLGARLRLLYAFPASPQEMFGLPAEYPDRETLKYFSPDAFEKLRKESAEAAFAAARKAIGDTGADVEERVITGAAGEAILEHASGMTNATIVMGRRGLSHFKEIMMGSTTQRVLHHAKCPVLVVR